MDNVTLQIEKYAHEFNSYIQATIYFRETFLPDSDFEDVVDILHPIIKARIAQEFKDRGFFGKREKNLWDFCEED